MNDGPLTIGEVVVKVGARGEIPPKMLLLYATVDYSLPRASLGRTSARGTADLPLPGNVRMYDVAGASHVTVVEADGCTLPPTPLDWASVARHAAAAGPMGGAQPGPARDPADAAPARRG